MKNSLFAFALTLLLGSCSSNTETNQDSSLASETSNSNSLKEDNERIDEDASVEMKSLDHEVFISNILKGDNEAIYEDASREMKSFVSEEVFLSITNLQGKLYGKMVDAKLISKTSGKYRFNGTKIYGYELKNEEGKSFNLTAEFLRGHLLKNFIEEPDWSKESKFVKNLVNPIKKLVFQQNSKKIYELLDKKYPQDQVKSLLQKIVRNCAGATYKYKYNWSDNDKNGKMIIAFVYAYEGKGELEYRFYVENENYPFGGIYFTPDESTKLP